MSCEDAEGESALSSGDSPRVLWDDKVAYAPPDEGESGDSPRVLWDDNMVYAPPDQGESGESPRVLSRSPFRSSEDVRSPNTTLSSSSARSWSSEDDNEAYAPPDEKNWRKMKKKNWRNKRRSWRGCEKGILN